MRFLTPLLSASLLVAGTFAAKQATVDRFDQLHAESLKSSPLKLADDEAFKSLTSAPRDYSALVLLTVLDPRYGCPLCREFEPEWELLSKSWNKGDKAGESRLLFGTLDFTNGRETFMSLGLQTAPILMMYPPTSGPFATADQEILRYDLAQRPLTAEGVQEWLARHLPGRPHPEIKRPINWMRWIASITLILGLGAVMTTILPYILPILQNRNVWATVSMISILLFISGHMFNHIRKVPYVAGDGRGGVTYFVNNFQNQLGLETQIVAAIYGIMSFCVIALAVKVPRISSSRSQQAAVLASGAALFVIYSFLMSVFRVKNGGYPFSLPPFM